MTGFIKGWFWTFFAFFIVLVIYGLYVFIGWAVVSTLLRILFG